MIFPVTDNCTLDSIDRQEKKAKEADLSLYKKDKWEKETLEIKAQHNVKTTYCTSEAGWWL